MIRTFRGDQVLQIQPSPIWYKVTGMLQQNWAVVIENADLKAEAVFFDDLSYVFDRKYFDSREICEQGLRYNGFSLLEENARFKEVAGEPTFPLIERKRGSRPVYSSGEFWKDPG